MEKQSYINALNWAFLILKKHHQDPDTARYLLLERTNWNFTQFSLHQNEIMPLWLQQQYHQDIQRAIKAEPPQYILGYAWFYGRKFKVNYQTLIPRQDSEAMIAQVLQDSPSDSTLLELGTGSGALIITLGLEGHFQNLTATDVSSAALQMAQDNSKNYHVPIKLFSGDLFSPVVGQKFDIIVFNPPYIAKTETALMDPSVLKFEPHLALFAEQEGLAFYQRIFAQVDNFLNPDGKIYLEFGFQQQSKISKMIKEQLPTWQARFFHDFSDNPRFLCLQRKEVR